MRPFSTFGVSPFLHAEKGDMKALQDLFFSLARQYHPDMLVKLPQKEREEREAQSARLNADYKILKDFYARLEAVAKSGTICPPRNGVPPDFAEEYFELQEAWAEESDHGKVIPQVEAFTQKVADRLKRVEEALHKFAEHYPFQGIGPETAPWSADDVKRLNEQLQELRYYRRFLDDIQSKFGA